MRASLTAGTVVSYARPLREDDAGSVAVAARWRQVCSRHKTCTHEVPVETQPQRCGVLRELLRFECKMRATVVPLALPRLLWLGGSCVQRPEMH